MATNKTVLRSHPVKTGSTGRKVRNRSLTNKISDQVNKWSVRAGYGISAAPNALGGLRTPRNIGLKVHRHNRDLNAVLKGNVKGRVNNRLKGRVGGLLVNAILPNFNNIALRFVRAKIGSRMNKALHKKYRNLNVLEMFGGQATRSITKNFYGANGEKGAGGQMHNWLFATLNALAPRTEFSMNIDGTVVDFGPNNLAMSIHKLPVIVKPDQFTLASFPVNIGGATAESTVADRAPYVWLANYGGMLINPEEPNKPKAYAPTFFAERSLEFVGRTFKPVIKGMAEFLIKDNPKFAGKKIDTSKLIKTEYSDRSKKLQKIWLSKDAEAVKKEILSEGKGRRESVKYNTAELGEQSFTDYYSKRGAHYLSDDGTMNAEAVQTGADNIMKILYGDEFVKKEVIKKRTKKDGTIDKRYKDPEYKATVEIPLAVSSGQGSFPIYASMRERIKDPTTGKYVAAGDYSETFIEPGKVVAKRINGQVNLGNVVFGEREMKILRPHIQNGNIVVKKDGRDGKMHLEIQKNADEVLNDLDIVSKGGTVNTLKDIEDQTGSTLKKWNEERLKPPTQKDPKTGKIITNESAEPIPLRKDLEFREEGKKAAAKLISETDSALRISSSDRIVQITGKKNPTNSQVINSITDPELKSKVQNELIKNRRGYGINSRFDPEKLSNDLKARLGFYTDAEIGFDNMPDGGFGVARVTTSDHKYISQLRRNESRIQTEIQDAKRGVLKAEKDARTISTINAHTKDYGKGGAPTEVYRTSYGYDDRGVDDATRLALGRSEKIAIPTDPKAKPVIWTTGTRVAKNDYYHPGFGVVKEGHKVPLSPTNRSLKSKANMNKYGIKSLNDGSAAVKRASKKVEMLENKLLTTRMEIEATTKRVNAIDSLTKPKTTGKTDAKGRPVIQAAPLNTQARGAYNTARDNYLNNRTSEAIPDYLQGMKPINADSGLFIQQSNLLAARGPRIGTRNPEHRDLYTAALKSGNVTNLTFTFKKGMDSGQLRARGISSFEARIHSPRLGGGHKSNSKKLKPIITKRKSGSHTDITDFTYKSDTFPTGKLVLSQEVNRANPNRISGAEPTAKFGGQSGTAIIPLTRNRFNPEELGPVSGVLDEMMMFMNKKDVGQQPEGVDIGGWKTSTTLGGGVIIRFEDR